MNIFLDTSILYKDPYWRGNFYGELLEVVKEKEVNLFVSSVVIKEIERNYGKIVDEENSKISKIIDQKEHYITNDLIIGSKNKNLMRHFF
jgi:hypothetical protein